jgi:hypothetical protein
MENQKNSNIMKTMKTLKLTVLAALLLGGSGTVLQAVSFGFEGQTSGNYGSISETVGGLTITVTPDGSSSLNVSGPLGPASWGNRSLTPVYSGGLGLVVDFSSAVTSAGIQFGDYDQDDDPVTFNAYSGLDGTGTLLGTTSLDYTSSLNINNGDVDVRSLSIGAAGIMSFVVTSGGFYPGSLYYDNVTADIGVGVPDSGATLGLFGNEFGGIIRPAAKTPLRVLTDFKNEMAKRPGESSDLKPNNQ